MNNQDQARPGVISNRVDNDDMIKGRWKEVKGGVRKVWGQLTDDELEETKGDMTSVAGLIQRKFGESRATIEEKLDSVFKEFHNKDIEQDSALDDYEKQELDRMENESPSESPIDAANRNTRERQL